MECVCFFFFIVSLIIGGTSLNYTPGTSDLEATTSVNTTEKIVYHISTESPQPSTKEEELDVTFKHKDEDEDHARVGKVVQPTQIPTPTAISTPVVLKYPNVKQKIASDKLQEPQSPPLITWPKTNSIEVVEKRLFVTCTAKGHPPPIFTWLRNELPIRSSGKDIQAFENGTLYAATFSKSLDGYFQCQAANKHGTSVSVMKPIKMKVGVPDGKLPEWSESQESYTRNQREHFSLKCEPVPVTLPRSTKGWYFDDHKELKYDDRIAADSKGVLHFASLETGDQKTYYCGQKWESDIKLYKKGELRIEAKQEGGDRAPVEQYVSQDVKANLFEEVVLDCFFGGYPIPEITWKNADNHDIKLLDERYEMKTQIGNRQLVIKKLSENDEGKFHCTAKNIKGTAEKAINVNVTSPPRQIQDRGLIGLTSPDRRDYKLYCESDHVINERTDTPKWFRNGVPLSSANLPDPNRYSFNDAMTILHIKNLSKSEDTACYQCNVTNSEGHLYMNGYLNVVNSIEITSRPEEHIKVDMNQSAIDISVQARGDQCCEIRFRWKLNGTVLLPKTLSEPPFSYNVRTKKRTFNASSVSLEELYSKLGQYECEVSTTHEIRNVKFVISMREEDTVTISPAPRAAEGSINLLWLPIVVCAILAIIAIVGYIYYKKKTPQDTYQLGEKEVEHNLDPEQDLLNQSFHEI